LISAFVPYLFPFKSYRCFEKLERSILLRQLVQNPEFNANLFIKLDIIVKLLKIITKSKYRDGIKIPESLGLSAVRLKRNFMDYEETTLILK